MSVHGCYIREYLPWFCLMQMEKISNTIIRCTNVRYAGAAGTIDGHILKT